MKSSDVDPGEMRLGHSIVEYGLRADGTHGRLDRDLGNFTIAGNFKCKRCLHGAAAVDAFDGIRCRMCGNGAYEYDVIPAWTCRAVFRFLDGRSEIRFVDSRRPPTWQLIDRSNAERFVDEQAFIMVRRTFERRDWAAAYGFIGPTRDAEYHER